MNVIDSSDPDIIVGTETWLNPAIYSSEVIPSNYITYRRDRPDGYGGVLLAVRNNFVVEQLEDTGEDGIEAVFGMISLFQKQKLIIGAFYRPPNKSHPEYLDQFNESLRRIMTNKSAQIVVGGDFNCGGIDWGNMFVPSGANQCHTQKQLVDIVKEHCLNQVVDLPTRQDKDIRPPSDKQPCTC